MAVRRTRRVKTPSKTDPEKNIQSSIGSFLKRGKLIFNRVNNGMFEKMSTKLSGAVKKRRIRCNSLEGISDLEVYTYMENKHGTRFQVMIYLEVKTTVGKQSETQISFDSFVDELGGLYFLVTSVEETYAALLKSKEYMEKVVPGFKLYIGRASV